MYKIPIVYKNRNLEILTKLLNSVAKKYGCHVEYVAEEESIRFFGDMDCCQHVTEETLALFPKTLEKDRLPLNCSLNETVTSPDQEGRS